MTRFAVLVCAALGVLCAPGSPAWAQTVALAGMLGGKALVIVDGSAPKTVSAGETFKGVKVVSTQGDVAVLEIGGKRHTLRVGDAPASVGGGEGSESSGQRIVLTAGNGGHFFSVGQINGQAVQLMVDTDATVVALSQADAKRIRLNYRSGQQTQISTANGVIPAWRIKLASLRVGDVVVYEVESVVTSGSMPYVLLGNSFLSRFSMTRTNNEMVLEKRF
jgi:aspartyl protease family protein